MDHQASEDGSRKPVLHNEGASRAMWATAFLLPFLSLFVFQPWLPHPHPVWDWGDLVPLFRSSEGLVETVQVLAERYGLEGRANLLGYLQLALTWHVAGDSAVGWQMIRAAQMLAMGVLFVAACRRGGATPLAAGLGGLIMLLGASSVEGWLFIMGEPLGTCFLLVMFLLCAGYPSSDRWRRDAVLVGAAGLCVLLTKEFLGFAILPIIALAFLGDGRYGLGKWRWETRDRWLFVSLALALAVKLLILIPVLLAPTPPGYSSAYGSSATSTEGVLALILAMSLPTWFASSRLGALWYPANLLTIILLVGGGLLGLRRCWPRVPVWGLLSLLPLLGALAYSFWPRYSAFYGIPFWTASAGLLVACVASMHPISRSTSLAANTALLLIAFYCGIVAERTVREKHALAGVAEDIARAIPIWQGVDSIFVVAPASGVRRWPVTGGELERYAIALGVPGSSVPGGQDITCEAALERLRSGLTRAALINDPRVCGTLPVRTDLHLRAYTYLDWLSLGRLGDSVIVESLVPSLFAERQGPER